MEKNFGTQERLANLQAAEIDRRQRGIKVVDNDILGSHLRTATSDGVFPAPSQSALSLKLLGTTRSNSAALRTLKKALKLADVTTTAFAPAAIRGLTTGDIVPDENFAIGTIGPYTITKTFLGTHLADLKLEELYARQDSDVPLTPAETKRLESPGLFIVRSIVVLKKTMKVVYYVLRLYFGPAAMVTTLCQTMYLWVEANDDKLEDLITNFSATHRALPAQLQYIFDYKITNVFRIAESTIPTAADTAFDSVLTQILDRTYTIILPNNIQQLVEVLTIPTQPQPGYAAPPGLPPPIAHPLRRRDPIHDRPNLHVPVADGVHRGAPQDLLCTRAYFDAVISSHGLRSPNVPNPQGPNRGSECFHFTFLHVCIKANCVHKPNHVPIVPDSPRHIAARGYKQAAEGRYRADGGRDFQ